MNREACIRKLEVIVKIRKNFEELGNELASSKTR